MQMAGGNSVVYEDKNGGLPRYQRENILWKVTSVSEQVQEYYL